LNILTHILDSLRVQIIEKPETSILRQVLNSSLLTALGGIIIGFLGSWFQNRSQLNRQEKSEIRRELLKRRLDIYTEAFEALADMSSGQTSTTQQGDRLFYPRAYRSLQDRQKWLSNTVGLFDRNRFLLDNSSYEAFGALNLLVVSHKTPNMTDDDLKNAGNRDLLKIQALVHGVMDAMRNYLNKTYDLKLEK